MAILTSTTSGHPPAVCGQSRREVFTSIGITALATVAAGFAMPERQAQPAPISPDAELLALIAEFNDIEHQLDAAFANHPEGTLPEPADQPAFIALHAAQEPLLEQITAIHATTLEGFRARALMARIWDKEFDKDGDDDGYWPDRMHRALVRDLTEEA